MRLRLTAVDGRIVIAFVVVALFAYALFETQRMSPRARLFPYATTIPGIAVALVALARELRSARRPGPPEAATTRAALLWFATYFAGVFVLGFVPTTAVLTALYLRREAELRWPAAVVMAAAGTAAAVIFANTLHVPLPEGILRGLIQV